MPRQRKKLGFTAFKTGVKNSTHSGVVASQKFIEEAAEAFAALREAGLVREARILATRVDVPHAGRP